MIQNPIFIVGTERSGSNLLRVLLNELPDVAVPHPPHLMRDLTPHVKAHGDLRNDANFRRLIRHAARLVRLHFAPWPIELDQKKIFRDAKNRNLYSVYAGIYEQYRSHTGKKRWACKSTFMVHHIDEVLRHHKRPQFIHLVRDPRDVAVSARASIFSHYHPFYVAGLWRREQESAFEASRRLDPKTWLTVRYEDLIAEPARQMRAICRFLGQPYLRDLMNYFEKPAARELSSLSRSWENVGRPVMKNNKEKFRSRFKASEIALIENVCGSLMLKYGYRPDNFISNHAPDRLELAKYYLGETWLQTRGELLALLNDRNARLRLKKKAYLLALRTGLL